MMAPQYTGMEIHSRGLTILCISSKAVDLESSQWFTCAADVVGSIIRGIRWDLNAAEWRGETRVGALATMLIDAIQHFLKIIKL